MKFEQEKLKFQEEKEASKWEKQIFKEITKFKANKDNS